VKRKFFLFPKASVFILKKLIGFFDELKTTMMTASKNFLPDLNDGRCPTICQAG
jgi:hypothetical protein